MIDVKQVQHILGISYPTALAWAQAVGEMVDGKWLVPAADVARRIEEERQAVEKKVERLNLELAVRILA